jgi:tetratricopeptide (TPR) repeat protein
MNDRIHDLKYLIEEDPGDPFLFYALGLEYIKIGKSDDAFKQFSFILNKFPGYLPVYYQAAHLMIERGDFENAELIFKAGITLAEKIKDQKTLQELKTAFNNFLFERDL